MTKLYRLLAIRPLTIVLIVLPIAGFWVYFFALRHNIPFLDEFESIPYFLNRFLDASTFNEAMGALLRPNNEHRVVYARLVVLGQYFLTGGLNFGNLMLWGNASLVVIFYLLYRVLRQAEVQPGSMVSGRRLGNKALVGVMVAPLLLFMAQNYLLTFMAMNTLQYLSLIMLVFITFYILVVDHPVCLIGALVLGMFATFSMGNGMLLWPAGAGMLLLQRRWGVMGIWLAIGALSIYLYFLGYPVEQGNTEGFSYVVQHPLKTIAGFLIFAGSVFDLFPNLTFENRVYLPFIAGLILLIGLGYWLIQTLLAAITRKNTSFFEVYMFGCLLFVLACIALVAVFRLRMYYSIVLHTSYRTNAMVLWAVASVLLFSQLSEKKRERLWPVVWLLFLALNVATYFTYVPEVAGRKRHLQGLTYNQIHSNIGLGGSRNTNLARFISEQLDIMHKKGWYDMPDPAIALGEEKLSEPMPAAGVNLPLRIEKQPDFIVVESDEPGYTTGLNKGAYLVLKSDKLTYLMFAERKKVQGRNPFRVPPGFSVPLPIYMMQGGRYRLGLFNTYPDRTDIQFTNQYVDVPATGGWPTQSF
ncbi:hypothetical protein GCM10028807_21260 [Spirosoma daeguense]